jgi:copper resistance protein C
MKPLQSSLPAASWLAICTALALLFSIPAFAHTALIEAVPGNGAVLREAPGHINLTFNGPVRLVKLELMGVGHEMPTNFTASSEAKAAFMVETPGMHAGEFTVNWAVLGADGHTVADSYSFKVDPNASNEQIPDAAASSTHAH